MHGRAVDRERAARDRYIDFLRAASILVVVLGHWLMAVVSLSGSRIVVGNLIADVDGLWVATWVFQVMPVFFVVGGFANATTLAGAELPYAAFLRRRMRRLLTPVWVLLAVWLPVVALIEAMHRVPTPDLAQSAIVVTQLLWFVGMYALVIAPAPWMLQLHRRYGVRVLLGLAGAVATVDTLRFGLGAPVVGVLNFALVWGFIHQLGYFYADGSLLRLRRPALIAGAVGGLAGLVLLTNIGPYPRSMVGMPGAPVSNMNPPNLCLLALTVWQLAGLLLLRPVGERWLARPRPWRAVVAVNRRIMTILLWHLTALLLATVIFYPLGFPQPEVASLAWWVWRPVWLSILAALTVGLVVVFGRFEDVTPERVPRPTGPAALAIVGVAGIIVGTLGFAVAGPTNFFSSNGRLLIVLPISPLASLLFMVGGAALIRIAARPSASA